MDYKTFEADQIGKQSPLLTSEEDLINYYKCNKCGKSFYVFNDTAQICNHCVSNDIFQITDFDYFADLKKGDKDTYNKEMRKKLLRSAELVDLVDVGLMSQNRNIRKSIN